MGISSSSRTRWGRSCGQLTRRARPRDCRCDPTTALRGHKEFMPPELRGCGEDTKKYLPSQKNKRKGQTHVFRIDLVSCDNGGSMKYICSVDDAVSRQCPFCPLPLGVDCLSGLLSLSRGAHVAYASNHSAKCRTGSRCSNSPSWKTLRTVRRTHCRHHTQRCARPTSALLLPALLVLHPPIHAPKLLD